MLKHALTLSLVLAVAPVAAAEEGSHGSHEAVAEHDAAAGEHGGHAINWFDMSDPETPPLGIMFINFALLLVLVFMILRKPIGNRVRTRRQSLEQALEEATRAKAQAEDALAEAKARFEALDLEVAKLRRDILEAGKAEAARIADEAGRRAERMSADTAALVEQEIARMTAAIRTEVVEKVVALASREMVEKIRGADHDRLAREYLESMSRNAAPPQTR